MKYNGFLIQILILILSLSACAEHNKSALKGTIEIHVNQVALESNGPKSAVVSSSLDVDLSNYTFEIVQKERKLFTGKLTKFEQFTEWNIQDTEKTYYRADFSELSISGHFQLILPLETEEIKSAEFSIGEQALFKETTAAILDYFKHSRNDQRYNWQEDQHIRIYDTQKYVDVRGGWNDAGGDTGKYLSHLSYANFFNPQQLALVGWALGYSFQSVPDLYASLDLSEKVIEEVFWGADYLHRILDPKGFFYMTVFDQWNTNNAERVVTSYVGADGIYTNEYQAAFRQGAGAAIAALARAYMVAKATNQQGEYSAIQYLKGAERAFAHLQLNNRTYCDDGVENIIDDYTALLAAVELYRATKKQTYLDAASQRASNLVNRVSEEGWFISNAIDSDNLRPFYHAAEAGFPVFALTQYFNVVENLASTNQSNKKQVLAAIEKHLSYQLSLNSKVSNPFNYARQAFKTYKDGKLDTQLQEGFFIPHANETTYWWQGESARLSSLTAASIQVNKLLKNGEIKDKLEQFAHNQLDWTLGRNPYSLTMLNGFGINNPIPYQGLDMVKGGISNGITGAKGSDTGKGIEFGPETTWQNWRWVEQWLPHSTWFLLATTEMAKD